MKAAQRSLGVLVGLALVAALSLAGLGSGSNSWRSQPSTVGAVPGTAAGGPQTTLLVRFGIVDREATEWSGKIAVSPGTIERLDPWRFTNEDKIEAET